MNPAITPARIAARLILDSALDMLAHPVDMDGKLTCDGLNYYLDSAWNDHRGYQEVFVHKRVGTELLGVCVFWRKEEDDDKTVRFQHYGDDDKDLCAKALATLAEIHILLGVAIDEPGELIAKAA